MRIVLVACYEMGHQPFNLASPAAHLRNAGFDVACLDLSVQEVNNELMGAADMIGLSTPMHTALQMAIKVATHIRELNSTCHICFYGLYAGLHAPYLLSSKVGIDSAVGGEYEPVLVRLAQTLKEKDRLALREDDTRIQETAFVRPDSILPDRSGLPPLGEYAKLDYNGGYAKVGYVETSRGCIHRCRHCPITPVYAGKLRVISKEATLEDIEQLAGMGARHITFGDPDFLNAPKRSLGIVRRLRHLGHNLTFDFTAKIEHIIKHRQLLPEFGDHGCLFIVSAVEILNTAILRSLHKGHTRDDVLEALQIVSNTGITLRPSLMPFTPWTEKQDYLDLFRFIDKYQLHSQVDPIQLTIRLLLPPGSALLEDPLVASCITGFNDDRLIYEWQHRDPAMDELHHRVSSFLADLSPNSAKGDDIYFQLRDMVFHATGEERDPPTKSMPTYKRRAPRLTEHWFC